MGFDVGNITFQIFESSEPLPDDAVGRFAKFAAPPMEEIMSGPESGWVGPRHLMDADISAANCVAGEWLQLQLMKAERKVPAQLLKVHCKIRELAEMEASGLQFLNRAMKRKIKQEVEEELKPQMPPTLTGIPAVFSLESNSIFADATTEKRHDAFVMAVKRAAGVTPRAVTPEVAALKFRNVMADQLGPAVFSPEPDKAAESNGIGLDFMMWLWHYCEMRGGEYSDGNAAAPVAMTIEGPLLFGADGSNGALRTRLSNGQPLLSAEAKTALYAGKKLNSAKVTMARGEDVWSCTVDGGSFAFRSLSLPKVEAAAPDTQIAERMRLLRVFTDTFFGMYVKFLDARMSPKWDREVGAMREWIENRESIA